MVMKKLLTLLLFAFVAVASAQAQKFALIDMEYILKNIPAYERANEQMTQQSKRWQAEVDELAQEAATLYKKYQSESPFLSDEQRTAREQEILAKESEASELKRLYFGPNGELFKKRERVCIRRFLLAMCLALNDLYSFGDKRLPIVMNGMCDIIEDYAGRSFTPSEARDGELEDPTKDPMSIAMEQELASRKQLHIEIGDFVK